MMSSIGEGATPLMYACQQSREKEVLDILARKPKSVRDRDRTLKTPLHYCAENANTGCAEAILRVAPELLDAKDEDGYTALHLAVIAGNKLLLRLLISRGANVNALDNEKHSAVHWATVCGEQDALEMLLRAGANISTADIHGGYPLHYAAQMCGPGSEMGGDPRIGLSVLRSLLSYGVDINVQDKDGRQPILWAASADAQSRDPGARFAASGSADAILALVNAGASVEAADKDGLTALHCAASRGHTDCLETLVALCGANVDVIDSNGCTALFYAVTLGHADSTQLLLSLGAEPNRQDRKGRTPAHCGAAKGQLETLRILLNHGANLWLRNVKGDFPLHEAVASGRRELVRWLLNQRPDSVNVANNDGRCPVHVAAMNNNVEMIKILFDYQSLVNPVMRTSKGVLMTPLDAALHRGNRSCAKYLQLHGGVPFTKLTEASTNLRGTSSKGQVVSEPQSGNLGTTDGFQQHARQSHIDNSTGLATSLLENQGRMNDDVAIQHVERIEMPNDETRRRYGEESSGEEERTYRRRRRRRRSDQRKKDYVSEEDSESDERSQDSRTRPRRKRKESEDDDRRRRRKKDKSGDSSTDENGNRRRSRRRHDSSYESEEEEENGEDHYKVKHGRKKHYSVSEESEGEDGKDKKKKSKRESDEEKEKKEEEIAKPKEEGEEVKKETEEEKQTVEVEALVHTEPEVDKEIAATLLATPETEGAVTTPEPQQGEGEGEESLREKEVEGEESISKEKPDTIDEANGKYEEEEESRLLDEAYEDGLTGQEQGEEERMFFRSDKKPGEMFTEGDGEIVRTFRGEDEGKKRDEEFEESYQPRKGKSPEQPLSSRKRRSYLAKTESEERDEMVSRMADVDTVIKGVRLGDADGRSTSMGDDSGGSTRNEDSSVLLDSGIEPSPRRGRKLDYEMPEKREIETATSRRSRVPRLCRKGKEDDDETHVHTISVTQAVQNTIRKYHMERRIFYQLLELKRMQIRAGRANEHVLVKRLVDEYKRSDLVTGLRHYNGSFTFKQFERFLYDQLHALQSTGQMLIPNFKPTDDIETLSTILKKTRVQLLDDIPDNPILCTHGTHRCHHAAHAYTGIPCAAYITKINHHEMPKTRTSGFLPRIDPSPSSRPSSKRMTIRPVTLELTHGSEKQVISLPTDRLDKNKRYYVTFTIKGAPTPEDSRPESTREEILRHRHAKSF